ncbi:hypothetical protein K440DRAFT_173195 [Wilcoxina mikolae CBS 423.85]|nr:hypothetical protein K440DRAFT_173195 [Wilcoxina mikolae CBS 423.85]
MYKRRPFLPHTHDPVTKSYHHFLTGSKTGEDGLTYKESVFPSHPSSIWTTIEKRPAPWDLVVSDDRPHPTGAHSLMYLVRKVINNNLETISLEALRLTPYHPFGSWIWTDTVATRKDTLHLWTLFASAYPGSPDITNRSYNLPSSQRLSSLISSLTHGSTQGWLVKLRFSITPGMGDSDLRIIPELRNLVVLQISGGAEGGTEVDDGIVRSWCRAREEGEEDGGEEEEVEGYGGFVGGVSESEETVGGWGLGVFGIGIGVGGLLLTAYTGRYILFRGVLVSGSFVPLSMSTTSRLIQLRYTMFYGTQQTTVLSTTRWWEAMDILYTSPTSIRIL